MTKTPVVFALAAGGALALACSSTTLTPADAGPQTFVINGTCGPLPVVIANPLQINGPCDLGAAGDYTLDAGLHIVIGNCGLTPVSIAADFVDDSSNVLYSTFTGQADIACPLDAGTIPIGGTFTFSGGTGIFSDATGSAFVDGGVPFSPTAVGPAVFTLNGSVTF